jgi:hypothetical protein
VSQETSHMDGKRKGEITHRWHVSLPAARASGSPRPWHRDRYDASWRNLIRGGQHRCCWDSRLRGWAHRRGGHACCSLAGQQQSQRGPRLRLPGRTQTGWAGCSRRPASRQVTDRAGGRIRGLLASRAAVSTAVGGQDEALLRRPFRRGSPPRDRAREGRTDSPCDGTEGRGVRIRMPKDGPWLWMTQGGKASWGGCATERDFVTEMASGYRGTLSKTAHDGRHSDEVCVVRMSVGRQAGSQRPDGGSDASWPDTRAVSGRAPEKKKRGCREPAGRGGEGRRGEERGGEGRRGEERGGAEMIDG